MNAIEQHHSGSGDNVRDKIYIEIKSLAPSDLLVPMDMVFESIRKKDRATAKIQMAVLKAMAQRDPEAAALVEAISIYGELVEAEDHSVAWGAVSKIAASAKNGIVKDVCLAALLRLSRKTEREEAAKKYYLANPAPGPYAREAFLRFYADEAQLEAVSRQLILSEGELTGVVEGAFRLELTSLAIRTVNCLKETFPSYNASVLRVLANAFELNGDIAQRHLWLNLPEVKQRLDELVEQVVELLELSEGTDVRLYDMACPMYECYQGLAPSALFEALEKYLKYLGPTHSATAAKFNAIAGNYTDLPQLQRDLRNMQESPKKRAAWCRNFLAASNHLLEEVIAFIHLATPAEVGEWLSTEIPIDDASVMEVAFVRLLGCSFKGAEQDDDLLQRRQLAEEVDLFLSEWGDEISSIAPKWVFELAENLFTANLPHKALGLTSRLIPDQALWSSPFVLTHLKCLLEAQQYKTFDDVSARVAGAENSLTLMSYRSLKAERMGEIAAAIEISDQIIVQAPEVPHSWYRGCFLRDRYRSEAEQQEFQQRIPDSLLQNYSPDAVAILYFLTRAGNFKRAEPRWVEWFIENPRARAVELVNFHFGLSIGGRMRSEFEVSSSLEQSSAAFQFEQDGSTMIRLIVDDHKDYSEFTLKASSQLAELLQRLPVGSSDSLGMVGYRVVERLPPYVACLRIALQLRHIHNDGSDCFAMLKVPSDTEQLVPFLEEKFGQSVRGSKQLGKIDNIPLYIRGHALYPDNAFKGALSCWADVGIPKSLLFNMGDAEPNSVVLDAYGIGYLAVTDLVPRLLSMGISFILPVATKEALNLWVEEISDENFMLLGVTEGGKLFRTTASDLQACNGHILRALRLILDNASVVHPVLHDTILEVYSIKDAIDPTVYSAMQLSLANNIPWFCMDGAFAALHHSSRNAIANIQAIIARAMVGSPFDFEHKRHGFLLYALGALPLPLTFSEIYLLAENPNSLAGFILFKIIQNHGRQVFMGGDRLLFLLDIIFVHLNSRFHSGRSYMAVWPPYTLGMDYTTHVFNHGMQLFLGGNEEGTAESRVAAALMYMGSKCGLHERFLKFIVGHFIGFAEGHFMDVESITTSLQLLANQQMDE